MLLEISAENPQKSENKFTGSAYSQGFWKQKKQQCLRYIIIVWIHFVCRHLYSNFISKIIALAGFNLRWKSLQRYVRQICL